MQLTLAKSLLTFTGRAWHSKLTSESIISHIHAKTYLCDVLNIKLDIKGKLNVMFRQHCILGNRVPAQPAQSTSKTGPVLISTAEYISV